MARFILDVANCSVEDCAVVIKDLVDGVLSAETATITCIDPTDTAQHYSEGDCPALETARTIALFVDHVTRRVN